MHQFRVSDPIFHQSWEAIFDHTRHLLAHRIVEEAVSHTEHLLKAFATLRTTHQRIPGAEVPVLFDGTTVVVAPLSLCDTVLNQKATMTTTNDSNNGDGV